MSIISIELIRETDGGKFRFSDLDGLNDYEKLAAPVFEEVIENNFNTFPPSLHVNATSDDVLLTFDMGQALGDEGGNGFAWGFSLRNALAWVTDCDPGDVKMLVAAMRNLADYAESLIVRQPDKRGPSSETVSVAAPSIK